MISTKLLNVLGMFDQIEVIGMPESIGSEPTSNILTTLKRLRRPELSSRFIDMRRLTREPAA